MNLKENVPLDKLTWFQTGGNARYLLKPDSVEDLQEFFKSNTLPYFCLGAGSNTLIRDSGFEGVVIKLGKDFRKIEIEGDILTVGTGCLNRMVVQTCMQEGLSGPEFLIGIPGSIGGAVAMNAGALGFETKDILISADIMHSDGTVINYKTAELNMRYRHAEIPEGAIILRAHFKLIKKPVEEIQQNVKKCLDHRNDAQPVKGRTGGSTFKNPEGEYAWRLIDNVGLRGYTIGDAQFSEKHCNFIMNIGHAKAADIEELGELARKRVKEKYDIDLEWEIKRVG